MTNTTFSFDGQLHIPFRRIEETLTIAIHNGLDAVIFTDYGNTNNFEALKENKDPKGNPVLNPQEWDVNEYGDVALEINGPIGKMYVVRGEEVKTRQGHVLLWGLKEPINNGLDLEDTLTAAYKQDAFPVFSHLYARLFHGCGDLVFEQAYHRFKEIKKRVLGLEQNGQIPSNHSANVQVALLAKDYDVPCFGTSDIHGSYLEEHLKVGKRLHSRVPRKLVDLREFYMSMVLLTDLNHKVEVVGDTNTLGETIAWNVESLKRNRSKKVKELVQGIFHTVR